jgi:hypothetical protein
MGHEYNHKMVLHVHISSILHGVLVGAGSFRLQLLTKLMNLKHQDGLIGVKLKKYILWLRGRKMGKYGKLMNQKNTGLNS